MKSQRPTPWNRHPQLVKRILGRKALTFRPRVAALEDRVTPALVPFSPANEIFSSNDNPAPWTVQVFDANGDGKLDVVSGSSETGQIYLALGNGDGTFAAPTELDNLGNRIFYLNTGDFNNDGKLDILGTTLNDGRLFWLENLGGGTFSKAKTISASGDLNSSRFVVAADLNGDGKNDAIVLSAGNNKVLWYAGDGAGNFSTAKIVADNAKNGRWLAVADLNGDSHLDVVVTSASDNTTAWYKNDGAGNFSKNVISTDIIGPRGAAIGDFDGDGKLDVAVVSLTTGKLVYFKGDGSGGFGAAEIIATGLGRPYALTAADVDGDGKLDLVVTTIDDNAVHWFRNLGGTFVKAQLIGDGTKATGEAVTLADLDNDGDLDVFAAGIDGTFWFENHSKGDAFSPILTPPIDRTYFVGQNLDFRVYIGVPIQVNTSGGTPFLVLNVGGLPATAPLISGSGSTVLTFRYVVPPGVIDNDGITVATAITANGATFKDAEDATFTLPTLPVVDTSNVKINGKAPLVTAVTRNGPVVTSSWFTTFTVTFNEAVTGVDKTDFKATLTGDIVEVEILSVSGSGSVYTVTLNTGKDDGTIRLDVLNDGTIKNAGNVALGDDFTGGQVVTLSRSNQPLTIDHFYEAGHGDIGIGFDAGEWDLHVHFDNDQPTAPAGEYHADEVIIYGGPSTKTTRPVGDQFKFLGVEAGADIWLLPQQNTNPTAPFLGIGAEELTPSEFAAYLESDPRVNSTARWIKLTLVGVRGPAGAEFSLYQTDAFGSPIVWMATSNGIAADDAVWIRAGSHSHYNWVFTQPGLYEIDFQASAFLDINGNGILDPGIDVFTESPVTTYFFAIDLPGGRPDELTVTPDATAPTWLALGSDKGQTASLTLHASTGETIDLSDKVTAFKKAGVFVALGDINGDGIPDIVAATASGKGKVIVLDGRTQEVLHTFKVPGSVTSLTIADINDDDRADVILGGSGGFVRVYDGAQLAAATPAAKLVKNFKAFNGGGVVVAVGDVNGDAKVNIVASKTGTAQVRVFDVSPTGVGGRTLLKSFIAIAGGKGSLGLAVGDLTGDGQADIIVSRNSTVPVMVFEYDKIGTVAVPTATFAPFTSPFNGGVRPLVRDFTGDGQLDLVVAAGAPTSGGDKRVQLHSGHTGELLFGFDPNFFGGVFVG